MHIVACKLSHLLTIDNKTRLFYQTKLSSDNKRR